MEFTDGLSLEDFEEEICEMAHLSKEDSGFPYKVLLDYLGKERKRENNSPRIMIWLDEEEKPSDLLSGETLDTNVWTEINQTEANDSVYQITRISSSYQTISATVINNQNNIVKYAVTSTSVQPASDSGNRACPSEVCH